MIDTTTVGKGIAALRKQKQMTQQGLAAAVNVSHQAVSKWENGAALPDMQTMLALSRLFGVSMEDILSGAVLDASPEEEIRPEKKPIELKLEDDGLNMQIVSDADDAIARAMESCGPDEAQACEAQATVNVGMSSEEIIRMAPYVSDDTLDAMLISCEDEFDLPALATIAPYTDKETLCRMVGGCREMDWEALCRLAPFLSRDALRDVVLLHAAALDMARLRRLAPFLSRAALADVLDKMPVSEDFEGLKRLAPFLSKDTLYDQMCRGLERLTVDDILSAAPYLRKDQLRDLVEKVNQPINRAQLLRLAKYLPREQMDKLVYNAMGMNPPKKSGSDWDISIDLGRAYHEIRDAVHTGMQEAREAIRSVGLDSMVDGINTTMKDMSGRINEAFSTARNSHPQPEPVQGRSQRIRARIAEKALSEGKWDWICAHIQELEGDLLKNVLMRCAEAGHAELIDENLNRIDLNSAEKCRLAQTVTDEDLWERLLEDMEDDHRVRVLDYIARVQPEAISRFGRYTQRKSPLETAVEILRAEGDPAEAMVLLNAAEQVELLKTALREELGDADDLLLHIAPQAAVDALELLLDAGETDCIGTLAQQTDAALLPQMAMLLVSRGAWEHLDELLSGVADVDLSEVWPVVVSRQRWDVIDDIALHGDENTLREMSLALAELKQYDLMDSFIEELDPDTLERLLDKAMEQSDWDAIEKISAMLE